jgi:threonine dehydrogenase-like Zn-dependent dehydrogenase
MSAATLPETALAAVLSEYNEPLRVEELPLVEPEPGALLVKVAAATVCGSDVHIWEGQLEGVLPIERPLVLGHEIVGEVAAIGAGAELDSMGREVKLGDRVVWEHEACGHCPTCTILRQPSLCPTRRIGQLEACRRPPYFTGGFAQYSYVWPKSGRIIVPDEVESEWASAASCALRTVMNAFDRVGRIDFLDRVLIQGSGPLGLFATAVAKTYGAGEIIVIGAPADRLEIAKAWGADVTIDIADHPDRDERIALVRELTGDGVEIGFELSGGRGAFGEGVEMIGRGGRYMVVGTISGDPQPVAVHRITNRELQVMGTYGAEIGSYYKALQFMKHTRADYDFGLMLGERYGLHDVTTALERNRSLAEIKPVIDPAKLPA